LANNAYRELDEKIIDIVSNIEDVVSDSKRESEKAKIAEWILDSAAFNFHSE
jgi:hypothetical protein